jgi:hypothetical protein
VFRTIIPRNVRLAEAPSFGVPAMLHDKDSRGALAYLALAVEMIRRDDPDAFIDEPVLEAPVVAETTIEAVEITDAPAAEAAPEPEPEADAGPEQQAAPAASIPYLS